MKVLWCRILALKKGVADNTIYFTSTGLPKYVKTNFRHAVWEQEETDQDTINVMFHWNKDKKKGLLALINPKILLKDFVMI